MSFKRNDIKNFSSRKPSIKELKRSHEGRTNILDEVSLPPIKRRGFMAPVDSHRLKREECQASKKRRSSLSTDEDDGDDQSDFRSDTKPKDVLKMPKKKTGSTSSNSLHIPQKRSTPSTSSIKTDSIFESASPFNSPQTSIKIPAKKETNPFASDRERLIVPAKKKPKMDVEKELERMHGSLVKGQEDDEREQHTSERKCDFCGEQLFPITEPLRKALEELEKKNDAYAKQQNRHYEQLHAASSFSTPTGFVVSRPVSNDEKDRFCRLHRKQLVTIPEGIKKGYPRQIDFSKIEKRISTFSTQLEEVIRGVIASDYKDIAEKAYREQGRAKARSVMSVLNRFTATLPGYYGPMGAAVILKALTKMYVNTGYLRKHLKSSQLPLEYLQQVLVPEVGFRLIREDLQKGKRAPVADLNAKAKATMKESAAYGNAMFPVEYADIADDRVSNINYSLEDENNGDDDDEVEISEVYAIDSD